MNPGKPAVLVVDDHPIARATAVALFEDLGFEVFDAYNGAAALQLVQENPRIGVLFVDVRMPAMTGPELAEAALKIRPNLKLVFTSGYVDETQLPESAAFVPKPWTTDMIAQAVSEE